MDPPALVINCMKHCALWNCKHAPAGHLCECRGRGPGAFGPVVLAAEQLWGRLEGVLPSATPYSCLPLDQAVCELSRLECQQYFCPDTPCMTRLVC